MTVQSLHAQKLPREMGGGFVFIVAEAIMRHGKNSGQHPCAHRRRTLDSGGSIFSAIILGPKDDGQNGTLLMGKDCCSAPAASPHTATLN